jgi:Cu/Ag efflux pump CusA
MTAAAAVMGMVPLAITTKEGAFMWAPLGKAVVGGLTFSTLVTLIIVPVMYARFEFLRRRKAPGDGGGAGQVQREGNPAPPPVAG